METMDKTLAVTFNLALDGTMYVKLYKTLDETVH